MIFFLFFGMIIKGDYMKYKNIVFDFNGTIINDVDLCINLLNEMLVMKNHQEVRREDYFDIFTFPIIEYYKKAGFDFVGYTFEELANYFINKYQTASYEVNLYDNVIDLFRLLRNKGINLYILSASQKENLMKQVIHFNIDKYFNDVLGIDNIYAKSKLDIAKAYFIEHDINSKDTLFIGDTLHDYEVSKELGCDCILMSLGHQSKKVLSKSNNMILDSYKELIDYLCLD